MQRLAIALLILGVSLAAVAGVRSADSNGFPPAPSAATAGVSLQDVEACRYSIRVDGGGTVSTGFIVPHYYDSTLGWQESKLSLHCAIPTTRADGGVWTSYACPDAKVAARFGRVAVSARGVLGSDGGSPNGLGSDGGYNVAPIVRVECWGPLIPGLP